MSVATQEAVIEETLKTAAMYRDNCALRHGIAPRQGVTTLKGPAVDPPPPAPPTDQTPAAKPPATTDSPSPGATGAAAPSLLSKAAPWLLSAAALASGVGGTYWWLKPAAQVAAPIVDKTQTDLLQYLQSHGYHLPPGKQWQTQ